MKQTLAKMLLLATLSCPLAAAEQWWKGNLHTHTLWSDGDDYPEMIAEWYKTNGYNFLALSDHNILSEGEKWTSVRSNHVSEVAFEKYKARFGDRVRVREREGNREVRLATLSEFRPYFEEEGKFLMIPSEEISARFEKLPIHINVSNIKELIKPKDGTSVYDVMQKNIDAVLEQRERTGQAMIPHLNHPNFHYAVKAEDLMKVKGERFFEVYNGHPYVFNEGDPDHPSTERIWDIVLAWRLGILKMEPMYGIAVDDSHNYHTFAPKQSNSGRGWIMVKAKELNAESLIEAMEEGEFYASTGVRLKSVTRKNGRLAVEVEPEEGVTYRIHFVGTKEGFFKGMDETGKPTTDERMIGERFGKEIEGTRAEYRLKPNDLYVRAVVISSKEKKNGVVENELERAWSQPLIAPDRLYVPEK